MLMQPKITSCNIGAMQRFATRTGQFFKKSSDSNGAFSRCGQHLAVKWPGLPGGVAQRGRRMFLCEGAKLTHQSL